MKPRVLAIPCPFGRGSVSYAYYVDAPAPALIDAGVAGSPTEAIEPALRAAGRRLSDVRWILLSHGHWDHAWGAGAARDLGGGRPQVAIHSADRFFLQDWRAHLDRYLGVCFRYLDAPDRLSRTKALLLENFAGEVVADRELVGGERLALGSGLSLEVVHTPGHSSGSVSYLLPEHGWAFVGDAVQVCGSSGSSRFPLFVDPAAYRESLVRLADDVRPARLYLGHRFLDPTGPVLPCRLDGDDAAAALRASLEMERRLSQAATRVVADGALTADSLAPAAAALGYGGASPQDWPAPFFTTLSGYLGPEADSTA